MKLLKQIITKNLEYFDDAKVNKRYHSFHDFYEAYKLSCVVLDIKMDSRINPLWKKYLEDEDPIQLLRLASELRAVVNQYLNKYEFVEAETAEVIDSGDAIGVLSNEL